MPESQTDTHTVEEQTEKSPVAASPTEAVSVAAEPAPAAPEENRVGVNVPPPLQTSTPPCQPSLVFVQPFSWALVTSKNLPPSGAVPVSGIPPHVVKVTPTAPVGLLPPEPC